MRARRVFWRYPVAKHTSGSQTCPVEFLIGSLDRHRPNLHKTFVTFIALALKQRSDKRGAKLRIAGG